MFPSDITGIFNTDWVAPATGSAPLYHWYLTEWALHDASHSKINISPSLIYTSLGGSFVMEMLVEFTTVSNLISAKCFSLIMSPESTQYHSECKSYPAGGSARQVNSTFASSFLNWIVWSFGCSVIVIDLLRLPNK